MTESPTLTGNASRNINAELFPAATPISPSSAEEDVGIALPEALFKTITHFAPEFLPALARVTDPRDPTRITYSIQQELLVGILMHLLKLKARRNIKYMLGTSPVFIKNLSTVGAIFYPKTLFPDDCLLHGDTLNYLLKGIAPDQIHALRILVVRAIIRMRCLDDHRLHGYFMVAIDGTGCLTFKKRHCAHCLTRTHDGETIYYHHVLEAKLVTDSGFAFSIATEFIENEHENVTKQDCELKAFYRLKKTIKRDFPQMQICLLLDGLYAGKPVFDICADNGWTYLVTFKEGKMSATFEEYEALLTHSPHQMVVTHPSTNCLRTFRWVNDIDHLGQKIHVLECKEETPQGTKRFVWVSGFRIDAENAASLGPGGRCRWKIENQGFNAQKNGGYELEHAFSTDNTAMKNFYVLMQLAHIFNQLMEKGDLLRERIRTTMGSLIVFSLKMWVALTETLIDPMRMKCVLAQRIQIRFDTG